MHDASRTKCRIYKIPSAARYFFPKLSVLRIGYRREKSTDYYFFGFSEKESNRKRDANRFRLPINYHSSSTAQITQI